MKTLVTYLLIMLVAVQSFGKWLILLDFQVNQQYIAKTLCENRTRPQLKCRGKCQLAKKLAAEEHQNNGDQSATAKVKFAEVLFDVDALLLPAFTNTDDDQPMNGHYMLAAYAAPHAAPFHPPAFV